MQLLLFLFTVAPTVEKTEVFRKGKNFANRTYFAICIMRKHYFLLWTKETAVFPCIYHGVIFCSAKLFDCAVNFKLYLNIFIFLTRSRQRPISYRNQSIDLLCKSMDWFLYNIGLRRERGKDKYKSNIKGTIFELRSSPLFRDQPYKEILEVKCQACNFTGVLSFMSVCEDFGHIFPSCFLQKFSQLNLE